MFKKIVIGILILGSVFAEQPKFIYPYKVGNYFEFTYEEASIVFRYSAKVESDTIINGFKYQKFKYFNKPPFGDRVVYYYFDTLTLNLYSCTDVICIDTNNNSLIIGYNLPIGYTWNDCLLGDYFRSYISGTGITSGYLNDPAPLKYVGRIDTVGGEFQDIVIFSFVEKFGMAHQVGSGGVFTNGLYIRKLEGAIIEGVTYGEILLDIHQFSSEIPDGFSLKQNYPNPFNPSTFIKFSIPKSSFVSLKIYNQLGKEISTLLNEKKSAGSYQYVFNANDISSGIYYYTLQADGFTGTKRMILLK